MLTHRPLVSVILIVRNGERFVLDAVHSIAAQRWEPLELIIIDGGSTDGTVALLSALPYPWIRLIAQDGIGIPSAWNQGIRAARGDFLAFMSADDYWTEGKLVRQMALLLAQPTLSYSLCHFTYELFGGCAPPRGFHVDLLGRSLVGRIMETLVARRDVFDVVGMFDERFATAEDVDWFARANERSTSYAIESAVGLIKRLHDGNASMNAAENTPRLLSVLRNSIQRRRALEES